MARRRREVVADADDLPTHAPLTRGQQALVEALVACIVRELQTPAAPVVDDVNRTTKRQTHEP
jgi:hypothetical protein